MRTSRTKVWMVMMFALCVGVLAFSPYAAAGLVDNGDGTVTDSDTGLMWANKARNSVTWDTAKGYCEGYNGGGAFRLAYADRKRVAGHLFQTLAAHRCRRLGLRMVLDAPPLRTELAGRPAVRRLRFPRQEGALDAYCDDACRYGQRASRAQCEITFPLSRPIPDRLAVRPGLGCCWESRLADRSNPFTGSEAVRGPERRRLFVP